MITATGIPAMRTRPTKARGLRTAPRLSAAQLVTAQLLTARVRRPERRYRKPAAPRAGGDTATGEGGSPGTTSPRSAIPHAPGSTSPGYQPQGFVPPAGGQEIWPVTGAQEALARHWPAGPYLALYLALYLAGAPGALAASRRQRARLTRISGTTTRAWTTGFSMACPTTSRVPAARGSTGHGSTGGRLDARPIRGSRA